jgi:hypothetical protein
MPAPFTWNALAAPAPTTVVIRLNGRVEADVPANSTSVAKGLDADDAPEGDSLNRPCVGSRFRIVAPRAG